MPKGPDKVSCYLDHFKRGVDLRMLVDQDSWRDYVLELDHEAHRAPHVGKPERFPCIIATAFMLGRWYHSFADVRWFEYIREMFRVLGRGQSQPVQLSTREIKFEPVDEPDETGEPVFIVKWEDEDVETELVVGE